MLYSQSFLKGVFIEFCIFRNTTDYETTSLAHHLQVYKAQAQTHQEIYFQCTTTVSNMYKFHHFLNGLTAL